LSSGLVTLRIVRDCDVGIVSGRVQVRVAEQRVDDPHVDPVLEQVGREAVPKHVGLDTLVNA
jgi:hypothetical protein